MQRQTNPKCGHDGIHPGSSHSTTLRVITDYANNETQLSESGRPFCPHSVNDWATQLKDVERYSRRYAPEPRWSGFTYLSHPTVVRK